MRHDGAPAGASGATNGCGERGTVRCRGAPHPEKPRSPACVGRGVRVAPECKGWLKRRARARAACPPHERQHPAASCSALQSKGSVRVGELLSQAHWRRGESEHQARLWAYGRHAPLGTARLGQEGRGKSAVRHPVRALILANATRAARLAAIPRVPAAARPGASAPARVRLAATAAVQGVLGFIAAPPPPGGAPCRGRRARSWCGLCEPASSWASASPWSSLAPRACWP